MYLRQNLIKKILVGIFVSAWSVYAVAAPSPAPAAAPKAQQPTANGQQPTVNFNPQPPEINAKAYILMDANTGQVLAEKNMHDRLPPASLTKLMTAYVASAALRQGQIKFEDLVTISEKAWRMGGSRMFIQVGSKVPVKELLDGIIVASGNDASVAMAEHVAGTEDAFVQLMNENAARLGMKNTHYTDSTGMPDANHYTTAYDLANLSRAIINDYPEDYAWYKKKWVMFNNIRQPNRNRLLWRDESVDGIKTGHTEEAGYCLVSSALRNEMRLIAVVLGAPGDNSRTQDSQALLNWGYRFFETHKLFTAQQTIAAKNQPRVWFGKNKYAKLGFSKNEYVTIPANQFKQLQANIVINHKLMAPIIKGQQYGVVNVTLAGNPQVAIPVVALEDDLKANIFKRGWDHFLILVTGWFTHND